MEHITEKSFERRSLNSGGLRISNDNKEAYLTPREVQVVVKLKEGKTAKQIAWDLGSSHHTITSHITNIRSKLRCVNIFQLGLVIGAMNESELKT